MSDWEPKIAAFLCNWCSYGAADLAGVGRMKAGRPRLVIGFAAETEDVVGHARAKRQRKAADWIVANDVSPGSGTFGGDRNTVHLVTAQGLESWPALSKQDVGERLMSAAAKYITTPESR